MIELLWDDAELLAIADAVAATQARSREAAEEADRGEGGNQAARAGRWRQRHSESR